jgi:hypothetical protein
MTGSKFIPRGIPLLMAIAAAVVVQFARPQSTWAQDAPPSPEAAKNKDEKKDEKKEEKKDFPDFKEFTKDFKEITGRDGEGVYLPLYYNEKTDELLCVVPASMLKKNFLIASSIAGGPGFAGWMWGDRVVQWHEMDKKLVLIEPDLRYKRGEKKDPVADAIERTYTDGIVLSTPIVTKRGNDPVISLDKVFKSDFAQVGRVMGGNLDPSISRWAQYKVFPKNIEIAVDGAFMRPQGGGTRARVHFSIVELPENDYKPREADPRIGYFLTPMKDWTSPHDADTVFKRYIHRWDVRKAEPKKAVSDVSPEHRIVFYIEKTVPVEFRRHVREGILMWNTAFEKAGYRNAIAVEQQTDTVHAEKDPEDVRYSFFRWIVSGRAFAMGPSLANPLTGQLLDADIIFDDALVRSFQVSYAKFSGTGLSDPDDPTLQEFYAKHPEWRFQPLQERLLPTSTTYGGVDMTLPPEMIRELESRQGFCTCAQGMVRDMAFNMAYLKATGRENLSEEFLGQMIKYVTAHEVGHTLGLRHNFKASTWRSIDQILATTDPNAATAGSVMDYIKGLIHPDEEAQGRFAPGAVGPYDDWAIGYGYGSWYDGCGSKDEAEMLKNLCARVAQEGLAYATDEDTTFFSPDPLVNRWDNGSDLLEFARHRMEMVRTLQKDMETWAVKDGQAYNRLRNTFDMLLNEYAQAAQFAARYVGGQYINRDHKGDPSARLPIQIVPAAKQREALDFVIASVLSDRDFRFEPELLNKLGAGRWGHWDSDEMDSQLDYPIHDRIAAVQYGALFTLMNPFTLDRIHDAELKVAADQDAVTAPEVMGKVTDAIWAELGGEVAAKHTSRTPFISSVRRNLQRRHLAMMTDIVIARPGSMMSADIHALAAMRMTGLSQRIGRILEGPSAANLDDFTKAHLDESKSRIDRALAAKYQL